MSMRAVQIAEGVQWVGAIDWNLRDFHGYETPRGTTYSAYIVQGSEKTALVDTVKLGFVPELLSRISSVMDPAGIDVIVVNHVEPDHNGGLRAVMEAIPNARVVASSAGVRGVAEYHDGLEIEAVGADDTIDLGGLALRFLPLPMVHWPDSMFTYVDGARTLLPNDAFGQHVASSQRFADEVGVDFALEQAEIYYANILMPLGKQVSKAVEKVVATGWEIETVAPSHGFIWRGDSFAAVLEAYGRWTAGQTREKIVVAFSTMWGSTGTLADAIADGISEAGAQVVVYDLADTPIAQVTYDLLDSRALLLGSPTLHHGMLFPVAGYLQWLAGLKPTGKIAGTFGSYGWSSGATKQMDERLEAIGFELPFESFTQKYNPTAQEIQAAREWGVQFAEAIKEM